MKEEGGKRKERKQHVLIWDTNFNAKNFTHIHWVLTERKLVNQMLSSPLDT